MKKILSLIVISGTLTLASCTKPDTEETKKSTTLQKVNTQLSNVLVSQDYGYLIFKDVVQYENALHTLSEMTDEELDSWEASLTGFKSAYTEYVYDIE